MTTFDAELIKLIAYFEKKTRTHVKDAFHDKNDKLTFIVQPGEAGKAIGKGAQTLRALEEALGRRIRISEFSPDKLTLIKNLVAPLKLQDIEELPDGIVLLKGGDEKTNGLLIGRQAKNLRNLEWMVRRFHEVPEIKVE